MIIDTEKIAKLIKSDVTSYQIKKAVGVPTQMIDRYREDNNKLENMTLKTAIKLMEFINNQEENKMKKEELLELIKEELASMDEEIRDGLYDVYFQPSDNHIWLMDSGMEYSGDDRDAYYVAQIENQEVVSWA